MKSWYSIVNKASAPSAEINLFSDIGSFGITSQAFASELNAIPLSRAVTLNIDSRGGDVDAGLAIYDAIQRRGNVTARVSGLAASIASVILCAASKVVMPSHALVLIHNPWLGGLHGDADELRDAAAKLDKIGTQIVQIYARKTRKSEEALRAAMKAETLLTATEARQWGFCDEVEAAAKNSFDLRMCGNFQKAKGRLAMAQFAAIKNPLERTRFFNANSSQIFHEMSGGGTVPEIDRKAPIADIRAAFATISEPRARSVFFNEHRAALMMSLRKNP